MKLYQNLNVTGSLTLTGSLNTVGTITATTLVVQTITSSVTAMTGSNIFGSLASNTQVFTGSMFVTGSINVTGSMNMVNGDLTINGNRNIYLSNSNTAAGVIRFYNATSAATKAAIGSYYNVADEGNLEFLTGGTNTRMMISSSGNIGIGITTPSAKLHVYGQTFIGTPDGAYTQGTLKIGYGTGGYAGALYLNADNNSGGAYIAWNAGIKASVATATYAYAGAATKIDGQGGSITFYTATTGTAGADISWTQRLSVSTTVTMANNFVANAGFNSYDGDGLFAAGATYCSINTPGSSNRIRFGYNDYGSGQYWGRIGFFQATNWSLGGIGGAGNDFSIGTAYNGTQFYIYANGNYSHSGSNVSDRRKKTNINYITNSQLNNILKLKPATFNKITDEVINENVHTGFIAQDIMEEGIPNLVMGSDEEGYGLDYDGILALTVKALQELKAEFDEYKTTHP